MGIDRRDFFTIAAGTAATGFLRAPLAAWRGGRQQFQAIACDAFVIFDPRPVAALAERLFPGKGAELLQHWRARQFEYQWLRALAGHYTDFAQATADALVFAANELQLTLPRAARMELAQAYSALPAWPDVAPALASLRDAGIRVALLSNMTSGMLAANIEHAGLQGAFAHVLSTDRERTYKPEPRAYQMAADAFALPKEAIVYAAFAGWDAAGARWFGYPTFWVNRAGSPAEELGVSADATGPGCAELAAFVRSNR
jgi:2-haloacid dehalogenase